MCHRHANLTKARLMLFSVHVVANDLTRRAITAGDRRSHFTYLRFEHKVDLVSSCIGMVIHELL